MAVTTVGRFFGWFGKSARAARSSARAGKSALKGRVFTGGISSLRVADDLPEGAIAEFGKGAKSNRVKVGKNFKVLDSKTGKLIPKGKGGWVTWTDDMALVPKLSKSVKTSRGVNLLKLGEDIPLWGTVKIGIVAVIGYGVWNALGIVGSVSETAEETINNWFGVNCHESDTTCQEQGAKNMLMTGVIVTAIGVGGVMLMMKKPKAQEIKVVSDTGAAA